MALRNTTWCCSSGHVRPHTAHRAILTDGLPIIGWYMAGRVVTLAI